MLLVVVSLRMEHESEEFIHFGFGQNEIKSSQHVETSNIRLDNRVGACNSGREKNFNASTGQSATFASVAPQLIFSFGAIKTTKRSTFANDSSA
jgi:hypothetical protein